jgi:hypothetical protein
MRAALRTVLLIGTLLSGLGASAIRVEGFVRDRFTRLPVRGAVVTMERSNAAPERAVTRIDGHYRFEVRAGERAVIRFAAGDRVPRFVVFDATDVPREWTDGLEARLDMRLSPPLVGLDSALVAAPAGTCTWSEAEENMVWDLDRSAPLVERWNALADAHLMAHPEQRPTDLQQWLANAFDLVSEWALFVSFALIGLLYLVLNRVVGRLGRGLRMLVLLAVLLGSIALVVDLGSAAGPLRFLAFFGLMGALLAGVLLLADLLVGRTAMEHSNGMDEEPYAEEPYAEEPLAEDDLIDEDPGPTSGSRKATWWPAIIFFASVFALMFEGRSGLENTLDAWSLTAKGAAAGLVVAAVVAWTRSPKVVRTFPRLVIWAGGIWWFALPMVGVASASLLNRSFMEEAEQCQVWPVVEITHGRRDRINVRVSWAGERERLEMPRSIKEQLTTLDSLRCCTRMGLFGHPVVVRVEPMLTSDHPR